MSQMKMILAEEVHRCYRAVEEEEKECRCSQHLIIRTTKMKTITATKMTKPLENTNALPLY